MDEYLTHNFFLMNSVLGVAAGWAAWRIAHALPRGWLVGILGIVPVVIVCWLLGTLVVLVFMLVSNPAVAAALSDLSGAAAFCLESGIELVLGTAVAVIIYLISRWRRQQPSSA
jgi:uncharacterized membrane protein